MNSEQFVTGAVRSIFACVCACYAANPRAPRHAGRFSRKQSVLTKAFYSSGDVIADRRADYARMLAEQGDFPAAAELVEQALDLSPDWAAGWDLAGSYHEKAGNISAAIAAWRRLEALDDDGVFGARLKLAAHDAGPAGEGTAVGYVEALFDQYAPQFEASLVGKLGYRVPDLLDDLVDAEMARLGIGSFERALDLGCGTGLMGERLRTKVGHLEGVDISAGLLPHLFPKSGIAVSPVFVPQLIGPPVAGLPADLLGLGDHCQNQFVRDPLAVARHIGDLGAKGAHRFSLLLTEGVGADEMRSIPKSAGDQGQ